MKKRCTNSACRKVFSTIKYGGRCPHCGKIYPQLAREAQIRNFISTGKSRKEISEILNSISQIPIEELDLSVRTFNCLKRANVQTVGDILTDYPTEESLLLVHNFGGRCLQNVTENLQALGLIYPL